MATALVLGSTGMVGAFILSTLRSAPPTAISNIQVIARREPPSAPESKTQTTAIVTKDTTTWATQLKGLSPTASVLFSALATTRGAAGSFEAQYKIEHDLNIEVAKAAKEAGTKTYVLISAANANANSMFGYVKMKGEIEEHIKELNFDHTVIVQPGLISGYREESRPAEAAVRKIAAFAGGISGGRLKNFWAQDADVIAQAAVNAALKIERGEIKDKVYVVSQGDIIKLGKTEWKGFE